MKTIEIIGDNYFGKWTKTRTACRGIIVRNNRILMSYETKTEQWMIPGGGLESGENERTCCAREVAEETGTLVLPSDCVLEIDEYYENCKWVNRYFLCYVKGETEINLTDQEKEVGMEPRWISIDEIINIFSKHADYADIDEMRRGMYLREYTALTELYDLFNYTNEIQAIVPKHVETVVLLRRDSVVHNMNLDSEPYEMIKSGEKTIELRLFDEKRRKVQVGDTIVFTNRADGQTIRATVEKIHRFDNFEELYKSLPLLRCGYTEKTIKNASAADMGKYYSIDEQKKYGVIGIEVKKCHSNS